MNMLTAQDLIMKMNEMDNGERLDFLRHLKENHFSMNPLTPEEMRIIDDLRDGYVKVVENNEV